MAEDYMRGILRSTGKFANIFKTLPLIIADEADQEKDQREKATGKSAGATREQGSHRRVAGTTTSARSEI
jgi:hypothetical protein